MGPKKLKPRISKSITKKKQDRGHGRSKIENVLKKLSKLSPQQENQYPDDTTETNLPDAKERKTSSAMCKDFVPWPATFGVDENIEKWSVNNKEWWKIKKHPFCKIHLALYFESGYKCDCKGGEQRRSTVLPQPVDSIDAVD